MKHLLLLIFIGTGLAAQVHKQMPLPQIQEKSVKIIDEEITGWSYSLDGQWVSDEMTIPVRTVSTREDFYDEEENKLGLDNIEELRLYPTLYGEDTLYILVKIFRGGYYEYSSTKQKWQNTLSAYYYAFNRSELRKLQNPDSGISIVKIPLRDFGLLKDIRRKDVLENLVKNLVVKPQQDRLLVASLEVSETDPGKIFFQFSSQHTIFPDVEGVVKDFSIRGKSVYGNPLLLGYLHYEYDKDAFVRFFTPTY